MEQPRVSRARYAMNVVGVVLFIVGAWVLLSVAIVAGAIGNVLIYDRIFDWCATVTSAEQARWVWAAGLGFSGVCYAIGVFQAAMWLGLLPRIQADAKAQRQRTRPVPVPEHELPKTGPSPEEIRRRGMPRG